MNSAPAPGLNPVVNRYFIGITVVSNTFLYIQAYKIWKTHQTGGLSTLAYFIVFIVSLIWGWKGIMINSTAVKTGAVLSGIGSALIIYMIHLYKDEPVLDFFETKDRNEINCTKILYEPVDHPWTLAINEDISYVSFV
jgi:uncharacterized protein with PQ loop repeat